MKKILKKNQVIIYIIALMLVTAGYLNFTTNAKNADIQTSMQMESTDDTQLADIGDAQLVSSNDIVSSEGNNKNEVQENEQEANQELENNVITSSNSTNNTLNTNTNSVEDIQNVVNNSSENQVTATSSKSADNEYFIKSKLERDTMYSQMIETYEKVLNSTNSLETQKQSATDEIKKINDTKNSIMICENLISTKGFSNNVIFVNGSSISVIIGTEELKQEEVAQIQNIISREMNAQIENIHIATK